MDGLIPGLVLLGLGAFLWIVVWFVGRRGQNTFSLPTTLESLQNQQDAILVIKPGGKVPYVNENTRQMFHLGEDEPVSLQNLANRLRPSEEFLGLTLRDGQERFVLDGKLVQASSHLLAIQPAPLRVVTIRRIELAPGAAATQSGVTTELLQTYSEVSESISASLDLQLTLQSILASIEKFLTVDFFEIGVWEEETKVLVPYQYSRLREVDGRIALVKHRYHSGEGLAGKIVENRQPFLFSFLSPAQLGESGLDSRWQPLQSYLGVPLIVREELVGTLSLGAFSGGTYQQEDMGVIDLLSGQVSIAIRNARIYARENQRAAELTGLGELAQAVISSRDPSILFSRLVNSISTLFHFEIIGFLIYNPTRRMLEAQEPFRGLPTQFVDMFRLPVPSGSESEKILLGQQRIQAKDAREDSNFEILGLQEFALAAGMHDTLLFPLVTAGRMLGYLQFSNADEGADAITRDLLRLLQIVANQVAPIIENAELVQRSRDRAMRAEAQSRIASFASSSASLDEILHHSLQELGGLLKPDFILLFLVDMDRTRLFFHHSSQIESVTKVTGHFELLFSDPQFPFTFTARRRSYFTGETYGREAALVPFYQQILDGIIAQSWMVAPLVSHNEGLGEIWLASQEAGYFTQIDLQFLTTAASQLAGVVDQAYLAAQTDASLQRRVEQLTVMTRISRELSTSLDFQHLLHLVYNEALNITGASCGTLFMLDLSTPIPWDIAPRFYVGDAPPQELSPLELSVLESGLPANIGVISDLSVSGLHEGVRSVLIVPIQYQQRPAGLMILHAGDEHFFDDSAVEITQSLAAQAAIALGNALQYEKQKHRGELLQHQIEILYELGQVFRILGHPSSPEDDLLEIAGSIQRALGFETVIISQLDPDSGLLFHRAAVGIDIPVDKSGHKTGIAWHQVQAFFLPEYQMESAYYVAGEKDIFGWGSQGWENILQGQVFPDLLIQPLFNSYGESLGLLSVMISRNASQPDRQTFESMAMFGLLVGWMMDKTVRDSGTSDNIARLQLENQKANLEIARMQDELAGYLQTDAAQVKTIHSLYRQMEQMLDGIEIAELISRQEDIPSALNVFGQELISRFNLNVVMIGEKNGTNFQLVETIGHLPDHVNPDALFGQRNLLRDILNSGGMVYSTGNGLDGHKEDPFLRSLKAQSYVGFSLPINELKTAGVLALGSRADSMFQEHAQRMYTQLGNQVSVSLQNLDLLGETRRHLQEVNILLEFSRSLASLNAADVLRSLLRHVSLVLLQAQTAWVGLFDKEKGVLIPSYTLGYSNSQRILSIQYPVQADSPLPVEELPFPVRVFLGGESLRLDEVNFTTDYRLTQDDLMHYRAATSGKLPNSSLCVPLILGKEVLGILLVENFTGSNAFSEADEILAFSLAQQAVLALENSRLYSDVGRRATQLGLLTESVAEMGSSLNEEALIGNLLEVLKRVVPYDTATLWLHRGRDLIVSAVNGFIDGELRLNLSTSVEDSLLFQQMSKTNQSICVGDVRQDSRFMTLVAPEYLSWLGVPLVAKGDLLGVIALEKKELQFFGSDLVQAAETLASMAASALLNARLYEVSLDRASELDIRSERLAMLNRFSSSLNSTLMVDQIIQITAEQLMNNLKVDRTAMITSFAGEDCLLHYEIPDGTERVNLPDVPVFQRLRQSMGILAVPQIDQERSLQPLLESFFNPRRVKSLLAIPLISGEEILGWVWLMKTVSYTYSPDEIELAMALGNHAAIAIQNARLYEQTHNLMEDLEIRVAERTAELTREHQYTQALLIIITRLSVGLDSSRVISDVLNEVNQVVRADSSLIIRSDGSRTYHAGLSQQEIVDLDGEFGRSLWNMSRFVLRNRKTLFVEDSGSYLEWKPEWLDASLYRCLFVAPMVLENELLGSLFLLSKKEGTFQPFQLGLVEAAARQFSVALNNSNLYHLAKNQSESLSIMLRNQQTILESIVDGVLVTDLENRVALFNPSAERILNLSTMDVIGRSLDQFSGLFGKAASEWMNKIKQWSADPFSYQMDEVHAETLELGNGHIVSVHLAPVVWGMEFLGTVSIFRDITSEVMLDRLKSEFVANVSHELRTPLTAIKGYLEILLMGASGDLNSQQVHFLQVVNNNADRLKVLVDDLLDISRIEAGQVELNFSEIDLEMIAQDVMAEAKHRMEQVSKPLSMEIQVSPNFPKVRGDAMRVRQVLTNLVSNAFQYTPSNGQVIIRLEPHRDEVQVSVQDNGIGISSEYQERIFERFFRGKDSLVLATAGTGLGLAISKTMIEMQGGRIWFMSSGVRGEGSTFSFTLPVYERKNNGEDTDSR